MDIERKYELKQIEIKKSNKRQGVGKGKNIVCKVSKCFGRMWIKSPSDSINNLVQEKKPPSAVDELSVKHVQLRRDRKNEDMKVMYSKQLIKCAEYNGNVG